MPSLVFLCGLNLFFQPKAIRQTHQPCQRRRWMQSCSGQIFYLPVSIECILFASSFYVPLPLLIKWQREWLTAESRLLPPAPTLLHWQAHTHTHTHLRTRKLKFIIHVSCERGPISMTRAGRIRVKNCHSSAIVGAPWYRRTLKSQGKEQSLGWEGEIWVIWNAQGRNGGMF